MSFSCVLESGCGCGLVAITMNFRWMLFFVLLCLGLSVPVWGQPGEGGGGSDGGDSTASPRPTETHRRTHHTGRLNVLHQLVTGLLDRISQGTLFPGGSIITADRITPVDPQSDGVISPFESLSQTSRMQYEDYGIDWITKGRVAYFVMAGGMATRYDDGRPVIKATETVIPKKMFEGLTLNDIYPGQTQLSYLGIKLGHIAYLQRQLAMGDKRIPVVIWVSSNTEASINSHLDAHDYFGLDPSQIHMVNENREMPRLLADSASILKDVQGKESWAVAGHGAFWPAMATSSVIRRLIEQEGVRLLFVNNIDNIFARLSPFLVGIQVVLQEAGDIQLSFEIAPRSSTDTGGLFARIDGAAQIIEGLKLTEAFKSGQEGCLSEIELFNTNNIYVNTRLFTQQDVIRRFVSPSEMWHVVAKTIDEDGFEGKQTVWQFEQLLPDITTFLPQESVRYFVVPRDLSENSRFFPVKRKADLISGNMNRNIVARLTLDFYGEKYHRLAGEGELPSLAKMLLCFQK